MSTILFKNIPSKVKYEEFLEQRRTLMVKIVNKAFKELCK